MTDPVTPFGSNTFGYEDNLPHGLRIVALKTSLSSNLLDGEIDAVVKRLKAELDALAAEMKTEISKFRERPLFEDGSGD